MKSQGRYFTKRIPLIDGSKSDLTLDRKVPMSYKLTGIFGTLNKWMNDMLNGKSERVLKYDWILGCVLIFSELLNTSKLYFKNS